MKDNSIDGTEGRSVLEKEFLHCEFFPVEVIGRRDSIFCPHCGAKDVEDLRVLDPKQQKGSPTNRCKSCNGDFRFLEKEGYQGKGRPTIQLYVKVGSPPSILNWLNELGWKPCSAPPGCFEYNLSDLQLQDDLPMYLVKKLDYYPDPFPPKGTIKKAQEEFYDLLEESTRYPLRERVERKISVVYRECEGEKIKVFWRQKTRGDICALVAKSEDGGLEIDARHYLYSEEPFSTFKVTLPAGSTPTHDLRSEDELSHISVSRGTSCERGETVDVNIYDSLIAALLHECLEEVCRETTITLSDSLDNLVWSELEKEKSWCSSSWTVIGTISNSFLGEGDIVLKVSQENRSRIVSAPILISDEQSLEMLRASYSLVPNKAVEKIVGPAYLKIRGGLEKESGHSTGVFKEPPPQYPDFLLIPPPKNADSQSKLLYEILSPFVQFQYTGGVPAEKMCDLINKLLQEGLIKSVEENSPKNLTLGWNESFIVITDGKPFIYFSRSANFNIGGVNKYLWVCVLSEGKLKAYRCEG